MTHLRSLWLAALWLGLCVVPLAAQNPVSNDITAPQVTCAYIANPADTANKLINAIEAAHNSSLCPGADTIDLGGATIQLTDAYTAETSSLGATGLPNIVSTITIRNGTITNRGEFRHFYVTPFGLLTLDSVIVRDGSLIQYNGTTRRGGSIFNTGTLIVRDSELIANRTEYFGNGGAIYNTGTLTLIRSAFTNNDGGYAGGAIYSTGSLTSIDTDFLGNGVISPSDDLGSTIFTGTGGAIYADGSFVIQNAEVRGNYAESGAGFDLNGNAPKRIINTLFSGNSEVALQNSGDLVITNSTFSGNSTEVGFDKFNTPSVDPAVSIIHGGGTLRVQNSIFWGNRRTGFNGVVPKEISGTGIVLLENIIEDGVPPGMNFARNTLDQDPLFVAPGVIPDGRQDSFTDGDYRVLGDSPAINAGDNNADLDFNSSTPDTISDVPTDIDGDARIQDTTVDLGVHEGGLPIPPNLVTNGDFTNGLTNWGFFGQGFSTIIGGEARFYRDPGFQTATLFQQMNSAFAAGAKLEVQVDLGNTSGRAKGVGIVLRSGNFSETITCSVTIPPGTNLQTVTIQDVTAQAWADAVLSIRSYDPDGVAAIRVDNVSVREQSNKPIDTYNCDGFPPPSQTQLLKNGTFSLGIPYWKLFGDFDFQIVNGMMEVWRSSGATRPAVLFQNEIGYHIPEGKALRTSLDVGNSSSAAKTVQLIVRDVNWSQFKQCNFTVPANTAPSRMEAILNTDTHWERPFLTVRVTDGNNQPAVRVDNVVMSVIGDSPANVRCFYSDAATTTDAIRTENDKALPTILPDAGIQPDTDGAAPAPVAPPNPGGIPEIPGF